MTVLNKKTVTQLANNEMYSYSLISDFGWASHLNQSEEGFIVNFKNGEQAFVYEINNKLALQNANYFSEDQLNELRDLIAWIES